MPSIVFLRSHISRLPKFLNLAIAKIFKIKCLKVSFINQVKNAT